MRVEEAIGRQVARLRAQRQLSLADLGQALGRYLGKPWSRQAVYQAERGQRSFTAAELTALALALYTSVQALFRAESGQVELPGRAIAPEEYRSILLNRQNEAPLDGLEESSSRSTTSARSSGGQALPAWHESPGQPSK